MSIIKTEKPTVLQYGAANTPGREKRKRRELSHDESASLNAKTRVSRGKSKPHPKHQKERKPKRNASVRVEPANGIPNNLNWRDIG